MRTSQFLQPYLQQDLEPLNNRWFFCCKNHLRTIVNDEVKSSQVNCQLIQRNLDCIHDLAGEILISSRLVGDSY